MKTYNKLTTHILADGKTLMQAVQEMYMPLSWQELTDARADVEMAVSLIKRHCSAVFRKISRLPKRPFSRYSRMLIRIDANKQLLHNLKAQRKERLSEHLSVLNVDRRIKSATKNLRSSQRSMARLENEVAMIREKKKNLEQEAERCVEINMEREEVQNWLMIWNALNQSPAPEEHSTTEMKINRITRCFLQSGISSKMVPQEQIKDDEFVFVFKPDRKTASKRNWTRLYKQHRNELRCLKENLKKNPQKSATLTANIFKTEEKMEKIRNCLNSLDESSTLYDDTVLLNNFYMLSRRYIYNGNPAPMLREMRLADGVVYITIKLSEGDVITEASGDMLMSHAMLSLNIDWDYGHLYNNKMKPKGFLLTQYDEKTDRVIPAWRFSQPVLDTIPEHKRIMQNEESISDRQRKQAEYNRLARIRRKNKKNNK